MGAKMTKEINCVHCGLKGHIDGYDQGLSGLQTKIFKHRGHDPFSGQLYYQCPFCSETLQINPMDILRGETLTGIPVRNDQSDISLQSVLSLLSRKLSGLRRRFQHAASTSGRG